MNNIGDVNSESSIDRIIKWKEDLAREQQEKKDRVIALYLATKNLPQEEQQKIWRQYEADENRSRQQKMFRQKITSAKK